MSADNTAARVRACFCSVFPDLPADRVDSATPATVEAWDSLAALTLIEVLQEEFDVYLDDDVVEQLDSLPKIQAEIRRMTRA